MAPKRKPQKKVTTLSALINHPELEDEIEVMTPAPLTRRRASKEAAAVAGKRRKKEEGKGEGKSEKGDTIVVAMEAVKGRARQKKVPEPEPEPEKEEMPPPPPPPRPLAAAKGRARQKKAPEPEPDEEEDEEEEEGTPLPPPPAKKHTAAAAAANLRVKKATSSMSREEKMFISAIVAEIAEAQEGMEVVDDESVGKEGEGEGEEIAPTPTQVHSKLVRKPKRKREKEGDEGESAINVRRKVNGTASAKFKLEEQRTISAEEALEEFRRNSGEVVKESEKVIAALREDLARQTVLASESKSFKKKLQEKDADIAKLQVKITELNKTVAAEKKENQVLQAKLTSTTQKIQAPGSAIKTNATSRGALQGVKVGVGVSGDQVWVSHVKEELYGDLTNLMILSVKKEPESRLFECLQTGNNGSLHFKLSVRDPSIINAKKPKAPVAVSGSMDDADEDEEFIFVPVFDEERDRFVISLLPEYLRSEISFSRDHATRFYRKINEVLMKPPMTAEDEEDESEEDEDGETTDLDATVAGADTTMADTTMSDE